MTIDKAIEILQGYVKPTPFAPHEDIDDAIQLGIEALEFRLRWEEQEGEADFPLLPGETKE